MNMLASGAHSRRQDESAADRVDYYIGSGRAGTTIGPDGLMRDASPAGLMHADHWHHGTFGQDYWLPVGRLFWLDAWTPVAQHLLPQSGRVTTELAADGRTAEVSAWFSPDEPDTLFVSVEHSGETVAIAFHPIVDLDVHFFPGHHVAGEASTVGSGEHHWTGWVSAGTARSWAGVRVDTDSGSSRITSDGSGLVLQLEAPGAGVGRHLIRFSTGAPERVDELEHRFAAPSGIAAAKAAATAAWDYRAGDAAIELPDDRDQAFLARGVFQLLASYAPDTRAPAAPNGWSGFAWPYGFPQDLSFVAPALIGLGHVDIVRAWVEFYAAGIPGYRAFTQRTFSTNGRASDGVMWPWEMPIGSPDDYLRDGTPNTFQYEVHNTAYPAKMAYEVSQTLGDPAWAKDVAFEVIRASAEFVLSGLVRSLNGRWLVHVTPSMGQDEFGPHDSESYLCLVYASRYVLTALAAHCRRWGIAYDRIDEVRSVLATGFDLSVFLDAATGIYATSLPAAGWRIGRQKHPVQLAPLFSLQHLVTPPAEEAAVERRAYELREAICEPVGDGVLFGWTSPAIVMAASTAGDGPGLQRAIDELATYRMVDADWLQYFESSDFRHMPNYVTNTGLHMQAVVGAFAMDTAEGVRINGAVPPRWEGASFRNLVAGGERHSGEAVPAATVTAEGLLHR